MKALVTYTYLDSFLLTRSLILWAFCDFVFYTYTFYV